MQDKKERAIKIANYIIETGCTIREAAKHFGISKSLLHREITKRLLTENQITLYNEVRKVLDYHTSVRHIRGGLATKKKHMEGRFIIEHFN